MNSAPFLTVERVRAIAAEFGTPAYVYDQATLEAAAASARAFPMPFGLTVRFAMKALPNPAVLRMFDAAGVHIDASSGYEAERALDAGIAPERIQVTAQELPLNLEELVRKGVLLNACSLHQLDRYGAVFPGAEVCVRINPGKGTGHSNRTNVGGPGASFGIWHALLPDVQAIAQAHKLRITGMHTHIGSGGDPAVWQHCARLSLAIAAKLPDVTRLSLGGGFKVARMAGEDYADLAAIGQVIAEDVRAFAEEHGRELHIEIEPGTYLTANAGAIVASVIDVVHTGPGGYEFVKLNTGMTEILRPSMYGAQHPMELVPAGDDAAPRETRDYVVVGHCCESGDILTPAPGDPEALAPRPFPEPRIGDSFVIGGCGAYCSSMAATGYNAFPAAPELLILPDGAVECIRPRQESVSTV